MNYILNMSMLRDFEMARAQFQSVPVRSFLSNLFAVNICYFRVSNDLYTSVGITKNTRKLRSIGIQLPAKYIQVKRRRFERRSFVRKWLELPEEELPLTTTKLYSPSQVSGIFLFLFVCVLNVMMTAITAQDLN
jgi:hypothetical protein